MSELLDCGHVESPHSDFTRGYGTDDQGKRHCYDCCTTRDRDYMAKHGKITAYLSCDGKTVSNWPGAVLAAVRREWQTSAGGFARYTDITRVWARADDGTWWSGRGPGRGMYMRLSRLKKEPR